MLGEGIQKGLGHLLACLFALCCGLLYVAYATFYLLLMLMIK